MRLGLGQILQAMPARMRSELVEPYGIVDRCQIVVEQGIVAVLHDVFRLFVVDLREQAARFRDTLRGVFDGSRVVQQDLTNHLSRVAAGIDVVAHERDALGCQAFAADRQQTIAHVRRNPGVEAVGEDVIELAYVRAEIAQICRAQAYVGESQFRGDRTAGGNRGSGQIDADEVALRQIVRLWNQVGRHRRSRVRAPGRR